MYLVSQDILAIKEKSFYARYMYLLPSLSLPKMLLYCNYRKPRNTRRTEAQWQKSAESAAKKYPKYSKFQLRLELLCRTTFRPPKFKFVRFKPSIGRHSKSITIKRGVLESHPLLSKPDKPKQTSTNPILTQKFEVKTYNFLTFNVIDSLVGTLQCTENIFFCPWDNEKSV